jgi:hypothetical protein
MAKLLIWCQIEQLGCLTVAASVRLLGIGFLEIGADLRFLFRVVFPDLARLEAYTIDRHRRSNAVRAGVRLNASAPSPNTRGDPAIDQRILTYRGGQFSQARRRPAEIRPDRQDNVAASSIRLYKQSTDPSIDLSVV